MQFFAVWLGPFLDALIGAAYGIWSALAKVPTYLYVAVSLYISTTVGFMTWVASMVEFVASELAPSLSNNLQAVSSAESSMNGYAETASTALAWINYFLPLDLICSYLAALSVIYFTICGIKLTLWCIKVVMSAL